MLTIEVTACQLYIVGLRLAHRVWRNSTMSINDLGWPLHADPAMNELFPGRLRQEVPVVGTGLTLLPTSF